MFSIKGFKKEDLVVVATELGLAVQSEHKIVDLSSLIENVANLKKTLNSERNF